MAPRLNLFTANKAVSALRQSTTPALSSPRSIASPVRFRAVQSLPIQRRWNSSDGPKKVEPQPDEQTFPTVDQLPDVTEEANEISRIMDKEKRCDGIPSTPELDQGTPVEEILSRDKDAMKHMPKVMRDALKKSGGSRSFSTSARSLMNDLQGSEPNNESNLIPSMSGLEGASDEATAALASMIEQVQGQALEENPGLKFDPPVVPEDLKTLNFRKRYDTMQDQFTKMMMESGKLTKAQKNMSLVLDHLRTSSPPQVNPRRRLLGAPPASQLPLDPVLYLTLVVDSVAPLFRIRQQKGIAGGGTAVQIPHPLTLRQRRRTAIKWIIDASEKRRDALFANRVAAEVVAVAEGRSGVWEKRDQQHKIGISGRANLNTNVPSQPTTLRPPPLTVAPTLRHDSIELVDYNPTIHTATTSASGRAHSDEYQDSDRRSDPAANSPLGFDTSFRESQEGLELDELRPEGSPLRFWAEALRRRAHNASHGIVDPDSEKMKFSHSVQFNAVPDWSSNYIAYSNLKKLIYTLEKQVNRIDGPSTTDVEAAPLLGGIEPSNPDAIFKRALDVEMDKICSFYKKKEAEIFELADELIRDADVYLSETDGVNMDPVSETIIKASSRRGNGNTAIPHRRPSAMSNDSMADDEGEGGDSDDDRSPTVLPQRRRLLQSTDGESNTDDQHGDMADSYFGAPTTREPHESHFNDEDFLALYNTGISLKKRLIECYVSLCELRSFIELNKTGFAKALKKYDKTLDRSLRRDYLATVVHTAVPFTESTMAAIDQHIENVEGVYAGIVTKNNRQFARRELRLHLREHVVWERNTVWREMIEIERRAQAANVGIRRTLLGGDEDPATARRQGDKNEIRTQEVSTPLGRFQFPSWLCSLSFGTLIFSVAIFITMLSVKIMDTPEEQNCLAMLVLVSILWATEAIPLFVTSLLIPFLVVTLGIMRSDDEAQTRLGPKESVGKVFAAMWTPVIMLLLGGFSIAAALSKYDIARRMAMFVLSKAGSKPSVVLLTNMFVSMFLSMWISNVASPVLCYSIIQPLLRNMPPESDFAKALVLGIALAANVGGAASPIASPQNIIALQNMDPVIGWGTWFFIALPVCIISILLIWVLLLVTFRPGRNTTVMAFRPVKDRWTGMQSFITIVTILTIILWCTSHQLEHIFGDMGVIAIIPLVLFFGTGILNKEDFNNFLWTIIILAAGGLCLGKAVTSSGLLHTIAMGITARVENLSLYSVLIVFCSLILVMATFISHTVAALIILPLVRQIGVSMEDPHPNLLVMASALMCSVAMALPTSGFPNMTAIMTEVPTTGQRYLQVRHFLTRGIPASLMAFVVIITLGYGLMYVAGL
ncbi:Sodium/sulfate symporter [Penicillium concentricum]|uniref:Small ribosomal subunit protein uS7m n=1 Tax=Penicillium concentricum TaxID=293559 RepID=A0A9W9V9P8_9EURO|nr:Sodium/sulfate symporter [Penicillium concentricum]KAJ5374108.1 Sodium/sulfate symporter [Penicillium concentricum]